MSLAGFFRESEIQSAARNLYNGIVSQARLPMFYVECGVPDTPDGRFDLIALHAALILRRLRRDHERTAPLAQALFDLMFADMDQNLREMGVGDLSVGKRIKAMAKAFYGRLAAYDAGLNDTGTDGGRLPAALKRNLYRKGFPRSDQVDAVVSYVRREASALDSVPVELLMVGDVRFGAPSPGGVQHADGR